MEEHKRIEQRRYDAAAVAQLEHDATGEIGAAGVPAEFRAPYVEFEREIQSRARPGALVLDIGAGTGAFSLSARGQGRFLIASDISHVALRVAQRRAEGAGVSLAVVCADAELLPFRDGTIDLVTAAGALYCLNLDVVSQEIRRVLRADGSWIIVDSLNNNPIYRFNRWLGFIRRRRTALAVDNVPTRAAFDALRRRFRNLAIAYHGVLTFLLPLLKPALGSQRAGAFVSAADRWLRWCRGWAFKVVVVAERPL